MFRITISSLIKFLVGILLVQMATGLLVIMALRTSLGETGIFLLLLNLTIGVLTAMWFNAIAEHSRKEVLAHAKETFSRERERLRVRAEKDKVKEIHNTHKLVNREKKRAERSGSLGTSVAVGGAVGLGAVMLLTQLFTLGLLTLSAAGGVALGYTVRSRQEKWGIGVKRLPDESGSTYKVIESEAVSGLIEGPPKPPTRRKRVDPA